MLPRLSAALVALVVLSACPSPKPGGGGPVPTNRCEADLEATGLFSTVGSGARAFGAETPDQLIGGESAEGRPGDVVLENDRIRVVLSQPGRHFGMVPFGGWIVDADLKRPAGEAGRDQFGRLGLLHSFGRTIDAEEVEILDDGANGGPAVVAVTGRDALNDFINLPNVIYRFLPGMVTLAVSPETPRALKATTYYVLSPGETRVRLFTQFCNEGPEIISVPLGDLVDQGGPTEYFNPTGCSGGMGAEGCIIDPSRGFFFQGDGVAYAYRSYRFDDLAAVNDDATLNVGGAVGVLAGAQDTSGVLTWLDAQAPRRPGTFALRGGESRPFLRDFFVGRDVADLESMLRNLDGGPRGRLRVTVTDAAGAPADGARVAVLDGGRMVTLLQAGPDGKAQVDLPPATYRLVAGRIGHAFAPPEERQVGTHGTLDVALTLGASHPLTVHVKDAFGAPMPAKVTVMCPTGSCPTPWAAYAQIAAVESLPSDIAAVGFVPPSGTLTLPLAPGDYRVLVTRGPEYSAWPASWPQSAEPVDLTAAGATLNATVARVVDTTGWMSADLHVHATGSPDSTVANTRRVLSFLAEGVDVLVSTDHDAVTDFAPSVAQLGAQAFMATMIGSEISTFDYGHFNAYPMIRRDLPRGGPFDWAGGRGPTLRGPQLFEGLREEHPGTVIQINHPRGGLGVFTALRLDTDTLATHADPSSLRMEPAPDASPSDTRLFNANFDVIELVNGFSARNSLLNDWMTLLSSGNLKAGTAVSDTHYALRSTGGYSRTWVDMGGKDAPSELDPARFAAGLKGMRAVGSNAPFLKVTARKLDAQGNPAGTAVRTGGTVSLNAAAGEKVELTVEVQAPEWIRFDRIDIYTHADGREALAGEANETAPTVHVSRSLTAGSLPVVAVPGPGAFQRIQVEEKFELSPTQDTWYVVVVRSTNAVGTLYPLAWDSVSCSNGLCTANTSRPWAFSNPVLVDADGSGAYDTFPQKIPRALRLPPPEPKRPPWIPNLAEFEAMLRELAGPHSHAHDDHADP
jgi:hypothetical protein